MLAAPCDNGRYPDQPPPSAAGAVSMSARLRINMTTPPEELIPTRRSLLKRLKNWEDQTSWKDFFDTYWKLIYAVAIKAGLSGVEAQDIVQETVVAVARQMRADRYDRTKSSWMPPSSA